MHCGVRGELVIPAWILKTRQHGTCFCFGGEEVSRLALQNQGEPAWAHAPEAQASLPITVLNRLCKWFPSDKGVLPTATDTLCGAGLSSWG